MFNSRLRLKQTMAQSLQGTVIFINPRTFTQLCTTPSNLSKISIMIKVSPYFVICMATAGHTETLYMAASSMMNLSSPACTLTCLSLIHICRCRRYAVCRSRWSPEH
eukprot:TRINITY_DN24758_c0_g1_i2.p1 TRINITY_DN24758_c0_g1~~TRINITY_DN24758_c0_g1_i2.p1  ORF type:complete len:107 (+),score=1.20 TRINITY_DN24758_c0_g1_i2:155-475(+)